MLKYMKNNISVEILACFSPFEIKSRYSNLLQWEWKPRQSLLKDFSSRFFFFFFLRAKEVFLCKNFQISLSSFIENHSKYLDYRLQKTLSFLLDTLNFFPFFFS